MANSFDDFVDEIIDADDISTAAVKKSNTQKYPCPSCAGTGRYQGRRTQQQKSHCFSCRGLGYFKTDPKKLAAKRDAARTAKAVKKQEALDEFRAQEPEMFAELREAYAVGHQNEFIQSLATQLFGRGWLSENQILAWKRGKAKLAQIQEKRAEESRNAAKIDLTPIRKMFDAARANGYKKPTYRAEGLVINAAPAHGRNPGALYVKNEDKVYGGKLLDITFTPSRDGEATDFTPHGPARAALMVIAEDPLGAAIKYGQQTGTCACCGRKLTNKESIDLGIGPICRDKWGF